MKKKRIVAQVVTNILLVAIMGMLAAFCLPQDSAESVFAPYYKGDAGSGRVAIMINVYESSENVEKILKILDKTGTTCTFFVGGVWAEKNQKLLREMALHAEIGNHGYLHRDHATLSEQANREEILLCHKLVRAATGIEMTLFAPPSGSFSDTTLDVCEKEGYKVVMWSKDTIDWRDHDRETITRRATTDVQAGDLILMHPTDETVKALPKIISFYLQNDLLPSTVSDVIGAKTYF